MSKKKKPGKKKIRREVCLQPLIISNGIPDYVAKWMQERKQQSRTYDLAEVM